jgi:protein SCO1/2
MLWTFALLLSAMTGACAQGNYAADKGVGYAAQQVPGYLAHAGVEQRLGEPLPMSSEWTDENGRTGQLSQFFDGKPVALAMVYYKCVMLCPQVVAGLAAGLKETTLHLGKDYDVLVFSIDPTDTPADAQGQKKQFLGELGASGTQAEASVHFLTGQAPAIAAVSGATGFHYVLVPGPDGKMDQFAHSSVVMFATPDGKLSKYLSGIQYPARDLRMALLDASAKKISNPVDLLILYCCSYNPAVGKYSVVVGRILGIAGMFAVAMVLVMIFLLTRKPKGMSGASAS